MSYTKQQFRQGDILRAAQLNAMDDIIASHEERLANIGSGSNENYATEEYVDDAIAEAITNVINASY
jgi:hypothetical protein